MFINFLQAISHNLAGNIRDVELLEGQKEFVKGIKSLMETHKFENVVKHLRAAQLGINNLLTDYLQQNNPDMDTKARISAARKAHVDDYKAMNAALRKPHNPRFSSMKYAPSSREYLPAEVREYVVAMEQELDRINQCVSQCGLMLDAFNMSLPTSDYNIKDAKDKLAQVQRLLTEFDVYSTVR